MKQTKTEYDRIKPYTTRDGSLIRELMHPDVHGNQKQSLAEATITIGSATLLHRHRQAEEIYYITTGTGLMTLGDVKFKVNAGDTVCIPPGTPHQIQNTGDTILKLLCCCSPPYSHDDTELWEPD
ncbi:MAG TPA: cupin domain-containing protein [Nitrospirae bacterium]|nr:cupin domain-containing protein [Nitrospirota bacterium]